MRNITDGWALPRGICLALPGTGPAHEYATGGEQVLRAVKSHAPAPGRGCAPEVNGLKSKEGKRSKVSGKITAHNDLDTGDGSPTK